MVVVVTMKPSTVNPDRLEAFTRLYASFLAESHEKKPEEYAFPATELPSVVAKMRASFERGATGGVWPCKSENIDRACRVLCIKPTWKALGEYLRGGR